MVFTILAAADVSGEKHNLELQFPAPPSLQEVEGTVSAAYSQQFGAGRFSLGRMQLHEEAEQRWVELTSPAQLRDFAQLYVFNRNSVEVQKPIPPPTRPSRPPLPDNATHDEKTRAVFDELDVKNERHVSEAEWKRAFRVLNLGFVPGAFSEKTVEDLFDKAGTRPPPASGDKCISFSEWQRFAELYPTLLDSLYFRTRDYWEDFRQKQDIDKASRDVEEKKRLEEEALKAHEEAERATKDQQKALEDAEEELARVVKDEQQKKQDLLEGQRELDNMLRKRAVAAQDLEFAKEKERQKALALQEAQRDVDRAEQALAWQEAEYRKADDKQHQAENVLKEAIMEVDRADCAKNAAKQALDETQQREEKAHDDLEQARKATEQEADKLHDEEEALQNNVAKEREAEVRAREAATAAERERAARDDEDRALQAAREAEQAAHMQHLDAQRAADEMDKRVREQQLARDSAAERRIKIEKREEKLLRQEVRLREQRDALEEKEAKLRSDANTFSGIRGGPGERSPYRGGAGASPRPGGYAR